MRRKQELRQQGVDVLDFGVGDPVEPTAEVIREAFTNSLPEVSQYPTARGEPELREAYTDWCKRRFAVDVDPETEVLPCRGSKEAMFHLPLCLIDPSEERRAVIYPVPGYPVMEIGSLYAHADTIEYPLTAANDYLMDPASIPRSDLDRTAIVWLSYPNNPTGQDLPDELFEAWLAARDRHGFVLCSDECYTEIYFGERRPRSLLEFGNKGCLVFHSLSKRSGMTGYRSAMVSGDADIVARYMRSRSGMGQAMPIPCQRASAAAWSDEAHVEQRRKVFGDKREVMRAGLAKLGLELFPSTSTFYLWVRVPAGDSDQSYAAKLLERGIVVSPGSFFGSGNEDWFRIALVPSVLDCEKALERWTQG